MLYHPAPPSLLSSCGYRGMAMLTPLPSGQGFGWVPLKLADAKIKNMPHAFHSHGPQPTRIFMEPCTCWQKLDKMNVQEAQIPPLIFLGMDSPPEWDAIPALPSQPTLARTAGSGSPLAAVRQTTLIQGIEIPTLRDDPRVLLPPNVSEELPQGIWTPSLPSPKKTLDTYLLSLGVLGEEGRRALGGIAFGLQPSRKENSSSPLYSTKAQRSWVHQPPPHAQFRGEWGQVGELRERGRRL